MNPWQSGMRMIRPGKKTSWHWNIVFSLLFIFLCRFFFFLLHVYNLYYYYYCIYCKVWGTTNNCTICNRVRRKPCGQLEPLTLWVLQNVGLTRAHFVTFVHSLELQTDKSTLGFWLCSPSLSSAHRKTPCMTGAEGRVVGPGSPGLGGLRRGGMSFGCVSRRSERLDANCGPWSVRWARAAEKPWFGFCLNWNLTSVSESRGVIFTQLCGF